MGGLLCLPLKGRTHAPSFVSLLVAMLATVPRAESQSAPVRSNSAPGQWTGHAVCDVVVSGTGYNDRQTHTWTLGSSAPTAQGAMRVYAATWSVIGSGSLQRSQGAQTLAASWNTNGPAMSAPIAALVRASDGRLLIKPWHAQLRAKGGVSGTQQLTIGGKAQPPAAIGLEAFEFTFPTVEDSAASRSIVGSSTPAVTGSVGPMQPANAHASATCNWQFAR